MDALLGSVVNGRSKSSCQLVSVGESGQTDPSEAGQKDPIESITQLISVAGGAGGKLWVLSPSV